MCMNIVHQCVCVCVCVYSVQCAPVNKRSLWLICVFDYTYCVYEITCMAALRYAPVDSIDVLQPPH